MARPTDDPAAWATDSAYPAGSDDWSGADNKPEPPSGVKGTGFIPLDDQAADWLNWVLNNHYRYLQFLEGVQGLDFGDGSDGDADLDGGNTVAWASLSGSTYTATRNVFVRDLVVESGIELKMNGWGLYASGEISGDGLITADGTSATSRTGATAWTGGTLGGGADGGDGGSNSLSPTAGSSTSNSLDGDDEHTSGGGAAGAATQLAATAGSPRAYSSATFGHVIGAGAITKIMGGGGGGGGVHVSNPSAVGGGGGAGGGVLAIACKFLSVTAASQIHAKGGAGFHAVNSNADGGSGGGGGVVLLRYSKKASGLTFSAAVNATGGAGGAGTGTGATGDTGDNGSVIEIAAA